MAAKKFLVTLDTECCARPCFVCNKCTLKDKCVDMDNTICDSLNKIGFTILNNEFIKSIDIEDIE